MPESNARIDKHELLEIPKIQAMQRVIYIATGAVIVIGGLLVYVFNAMTGLLVK